MYTTATLELLLTVNIIYTGEKTNAVKQQSSVQKSSFSALDGCIGKKNIETEIALCMPYVTFL